MNETIVIFSFTVISIKINSDFEFIFFVDSSALFTCKCRIKREKHLVIFCKTKTWCRVSSFRTLLPLAGYSSTSILHSGIISACLAYKSIASLQKNEKNV